jgi:hypothetical protein
MADSKAINGIVLSGSFLVKSSYVPFGSPVRKQLLPG